MATRNLECTGNACLDWRAFAGDCGVRRGRRGGSNARSGSHGSASSTGADSSANYGPNATARTGGDATACAGGNAAARPGGNAGTRPGGNCCAHTDAAEDYS